MMASGIRKQKTMAVTPLQASQPLGASLAFLGVGRAMPLMYGSQGCTTFVKMFSERHYRQQLPQSMTVMDEAPRAPDVDDNVVEVLANIAAESQPEVIGLCATDLSWRRGEHIRRCVGMFRQTWPQYADIHIAAVNCSDAEGCFETGFALAVEAIIDVMVQASDVVGRRPRQVNVLVGASLTHGDCETLRRWIAAFGLEAVLLPDPGDSLDGQCSDEELSPFTGGGVAAADIAAMGEAVATLVIGRSLNRAADKLRAKTGVPDYRFDGLMGLAACDAFTMTLAKIAGMPPPPSIEQQRARLRDAMVDAHFMTGLAEVAVAGDADLVASMTSLLLSVGARVDVAVTPVRAPVLSGLPLNEVIVGDLEDMQMACCGRDIKLLIANDHAAGLACRLNAPLLQAGFPQYDHPGCHARVGYLGSRQTLFDIANLVLERGQDDLPPDRAIFRQGRPQSPQGGEAAVEAVALGLVH